jgi:hypothetical protein
MIYPAFTDVAACPVPLHTACNDTQGNLEFPWYKPWGLIFADLVETIPRLAVYPHCHLWYDDNRQTGPAEEPEDIGDLTFGAVETSTCALDHTLVPDFAITRKLHRVRQHHINNMH